MVKIKYDLKTYKIIKIILFISGILFALSLIILFVEPSWGSISGIVIAWLSGLYIGGAVFAATLAALIDAKLYFRRLKAYGYEIPKNKKDYDGLLQNMKRSLTLTEKSIFGKYCKWAVWVALFMLTVFVTLDILFWVKWHFMGDSCTALLIMTFLFYAISWLTFLVIMKQQSNGDKYRDDVEIDETRKERWSPGRILLHVIILFLLCLFVNRTASDMIDYIYKSKLKGNEARVQYERNITTEEWQKENFIKEVNYVNF